MRLADFRGRDKTLLLFWSPECGFFQDMLPDLKELKTNPPAGDSEILVIPEGTEEDRQMRLPSPVVLDHDDTVGDAFRVEVTPSAVLVDVEGATPPRWSKARRRYLS